MMISNGFLVCIEKYFIAITMIKAKPKLCGRLMFAAHFSSRPCGLRVDRWGVGGMTPSPEGRDNDPPRGAHNATQ